MKNKIRPRHEKIHFKDVNCPQVPVEVKTSIMCSECNVNFSSIGKYREHRNVVHNFQISKHEYKFTTKQGKKPTNLCIRKSSVLFQ